MTSASIPLGLQGDIHANVFHEGISDGSWENGMAIDPVCKMTVDEKTTKLRSAHDGRVFYFCSEACKASFDKDPHRFGHSK
jgi:YHS domain-containing protein